MRPMNSSIDDVYQIFTRVLMTWGPGRGGGPGTGRGGSVTLYCRENM